MASRRSEPGTESAPGIDVEKGSQTTTVRESNRRRDRLTSADSRGVETPPPRDPDQYALTDHFRERLAQPGRYATVPRVSTAIASGQLRWNQSDGWRFAHITDGVRTIVAVGDTDTTSPVVVTAWTKVVDTEAAIASHLWSATDIEIIRLRTALSQSPNSSVPEKVRPRVVEGGFEIGNHCVTTEAGVSYLTCTACGGRFRSKSALQHRLCRR